MFSKWNLKKIERRNSLLSNLKHGVYCRVGVSKISGVGVIAIRNIPTGVEILKFSNSVLDESVEVGEGEVLGLELSVVDYINHMLVKTEYGSYHFPSKGINSIDVSFYLNHSGTPNVELSRGGDDREFLSFEATKDIECGEEITQDYNNLSDNKEELIKQFPFLHDKK